MNAFVNTEILFDPINWLIVVMVLIFASFAAFTIWSNAGQLVPSL